MRLWKAMKPVFINWWIVGYLSIISRIGLSFHLSTRYLIVTISTTSWLYTYRYKVSLWTEFYVAKLQISSPIALPSPPLSTELHAYFLLTGIKNLFIRYSFPFQTSVLEHVNFLFKLFTLLMYFKKFMF